MSSRFQSSQHSLQEPFIEFGELQALKLRLTPQKRSYTITPRVSEHSFRGGRQFKTIFWFAPYIYMLLFIYICFSFQNLIKGKFHVGQSRREGSDCHWWRKWHRTR